MRRERASFGSYFGSVLLSAALLFPAFSASAGQLAGVSVGQGATGTRADIRLNAASGFKTLALHAPERLVVDLQSSDAAARLRLPAGSGIVKSVRAGNPEAGTLRLVFDLSEPVAALKPRMETVADGASVLVIEWPGDGPAEKAAAVPSADASAAAPNPAAPTGLPPSGVVAADATAAIRQAPAGLATPAQQNALSPQDILNGRSTAAVPAAAPPRPASTVAVAKTDAASGLPPRSVESAPAPVESSRPGDRPLRDNGTRPLIVAIDAGHGGQDSGAIGPTGKFEKNVTLAIAKELARQIDATPGMKAYLVRDGDYFIPLPQRAAKARAARADLFVSIHADAAENRSASGSSVYVLSLKGASSQRARWLADKENASDLIGGRPLQKDTLSNVLLDLAQSGHMKASEDCASHVLDELGRIGNSHTGEIEKANFAVLRTSDMPAMLVETAYISNYTEERQLASPDYQRKVAGAILGGVRTYFTRQPPPGTLFAMRAQAGDGAAVDAGVGAGGSP